MNQPTFAPNMDDLAKDMDPHAETDYPEVEDENAAGAMRAERDNLQARVTEMERDLANARRDIEYLNEKSQAARESRRRLVCLLNAIDEELPRGEPWYSNMADRAVLVKDQLRYLRGLGGGHDTNTETTTA